MYTGREVDGNESTEPLPHQGPGKVPGLYRQEYQCVSLGSSLSRASLFSSGIWQCVTAFNLIQQRGHGPLSGEATGDMPAPATGVNHHGIGESRFADRNL